MSDQELVMAVRQAAPTYILIGLLIVGPANIADRAIRNKSMFPNLLEIIFMWVEVMIWPIFLGLLILLGLFTLLSER